MPKNYSSNSKLLDSSSSDPTCHGSSLSACSASLPSSQYTMVFSACPSVPRISSVSPPLVNFDTLITIEGSGFSETSCENRVFIGGVACPVQQTSSSTSLTCKLGRNSNLVMSKSYEIEVLVDNVGFALHSSSSSLTVQFQAVVTSMSPTTGSSTGGSEVVLEGDGFTAQTVVQITDTTNNNQFDATSFKSLDYGQIVFQTNGGDFGLFNVSVFIGAASNSIPCSSSLCQFNFDQSLASNLTSVSPTSVSQPNTQLTLTGSNFVADPALLSVKVGSQVCAVTNASDTQIVCTLAGVDLGSNLVSVTSKTNGNSLPNSVTVAGSASVVSIQPSSGSLNGGTLVTIEANGMKLNDTSIKIGGSACNLVSVSVSQATCVTTSYASTTLQTVSVQIRSGGVNFPENVEFSYDPAQTPSISAVSPVNDAGFIVSSNNNMLTITGSGFGTNSSIEFFYFYFY